MNKIDFFFCSCFSLRVNYHWYHGEREKKSLKKSINYIYIEIDHNYSDGGDLCGRTYRRRGRARPERTNVFLLFQWPHNPAITVRMRPTTPGGRVVPKVICEGWGRNTLAAAARQLVSPGGSGQVLLSDLCGMMERARTFWPGKLISAQRRPQSAQKPRFIITLRAARVLSDRCCYSLFDVRRLIFTPVRSRLDR